MVWNLLWPTMEKASINPEFEGRPAHHPQVRNGHGYLVKGRINPSRLERDDRPGAAILFAAAAASMDTPVPAKRMSPLFTNLPALIAIISFSV